MASFSGVTFCFVLLRFRLYDFVEAAALCSIVLRQAGVSIATRFFFLRFFPFCLFGGVAFSEYFFCIISAFLYGEYVVRSFFPNGVFLPCDHGMDF